jgi:spermidine synthase
MKISISFSGLGVGIAAHALMMDGVLVQITGEFFSSCTYNLDVQAASLSVTEIDPAVYHAAHQYFGLRHPARLVLDDGARSIETRAAAIRSAGRLLRPRDQTDYVIHDCFTGGSVPAELFTKEFWWDLTMTMKTDGVLVVVSRKN